MEKITYKFSPTQAVSFAELLAKVALVKEKPKVERLDKLHEITYFYILQAMYHKYYTKLTTCSGAITLKFSIVESHCIFHYLHHVYGHTEIEESNLMLKCHLNQYGL